MNKIIIALLFATVFAIYPTRASAKLNLDVVSTIKLADLANNHYFKQGIHAKASGLTIFSITISCEPILTLPQRINEAHLGIGHSGWRLAAQSPIESSGKTTHILLTYAH